MASTITGLFVTLEGGEGAGKSVQAAAIGTRLQATGVRVVVTREPGGTLLGERLRSVLLDTADEGTPITPLGEALLFMAARAELVTAVIRPALARGDLVICDRFADSTRAYQGYGRGVDLAAINELNFIATGGLQPDLTVLLDIAPDKGLSRRPRAQKGDRFEREEMAFHERIRSGYAVLAKQHPRWLVADATQSEDVLTDVICQRILRDLQDRQPSS